MHCQRYASIPLITNADIFISLLSETRPYLFLGTDQASCNKFQFSSFISNAGKKKHSCPLRTWALHRWVTFSTFFYSHRVYIYLSIGRSLNLQISLLKIVRPPRVESVLWKWLETTIFLWSHKIIKCFSKTSQHRPLKPSSRSIKRERASPALLLQLCSINSGDTHFKRRIQTLSHEVSRPTT